LVAPERVVTAETVDLVDVVKRSAGMWRLSQEGRF